MPMPTPVARARRTESPSVSVVIPCFNLGTYFDEAVQSVLDQTYQDFEIVIVDDGSDDPATRHMLASYRRPRTRIVRTENRGLASARNTGLEASSGRYLSFLDADDILEPTFLERAVAELERDSECGFASCWLRAFGLVEFDWTPSSCGFPELLVEDTVCTAALTRRDAMIDVGGFDTEMPLAGYEDWDAAISLVEKESSRRDHPGLPFPLSHPERFDDVRLYTAEEPLAVVRVSPFEAQEYVRGPFRSGNSASRGAHRRSPAVPRRGAPSAVHLGRRISSRSDPGARGPSKESRRPRQSPDHGS